MSAQVGRTIGIRKIKYKVFVISSNKEVSFHFLEEKVKPQLKAGEKLIGELNTEEYLSNEKEWREYFKKLVENKGKEVNYVRQKD